MARKRSRKRSKKNSRFINRHSYRRKDKRKIKKTRKKKHRGGAKNTVGLTGLTQREAQDISGVRYEIQPRLQSEPDLQSEPLSSLSRLSSSRRVNVDEELLSDNNIGMINGHGMVVSELLFVVPEGICLWVLASAGNATHSLPSKYAAHNLEVLLDDSYISVNYRRYPPGSLIQEHTVDTLSTQGPGMGALTKLRMREYLIASYSPSFLLTGKIKDNIEEIRQGIEVDSTNGTDISGRWARQENVIHMVAENREKIEDLVFSEHDTRIMAKSKLLNDNDGELQAVNYSLSYLLKTIRDKQGEYGDIPTNWVGTFCRSGTALNVDTLKDQCSFIPGLELYEDDFGGDIEYEQEGESQLTHQSSLSSRRLTSNFKQIVEELYRLFNDNPESANIPSGGGDKDHFKGVLLNIKNKIDNIETLDGVETCIVFLLRKLNL